MSLLIAEDLDKVSFEGLFWPKLLYGFMILWESFQGC